MGQSDGTPPLMTDAPAHTVKISHFYISKYPVMQAQYEAVMGYDYSQFKGQEANLPVEMVTWFDAVEFCNKLSQMEGLQPVYTITNRVPNDGAYPITNAIVEANWSADGYRLPTEAEWEYACRAGTTTAYNWGTDSITTNQANYGKPTTGATTPVGSFDRNNWRLYDMHGNVFEWCWDWYDVNYYSSSPSVDPRGPVAAGAYRVLRGGSWGGDAQGLRSAYRYNDYPHFRDVDWGFRLVRR